MITPDELTRYRAHAPNGLRSDEAVRLLAAYDALAARLRVREEILAEIKECCLQQHRTGGYFGPAQLFASDVLDIVNDVPVRDDDAAVFRVPPEERNEFLRPVPGAQIERDLALNDAERMRGVVDALMAACNFAFCEYCGGTGNEMVDDDVLPCGHCVQGIDINQHKAQEAAYDALVDDNRRLLTALIIIADMPIVMTTHEGATLEEIVNAMQDRAQQAAGFHVPPEERCDLSDDVDIPFRANSTR